MNENKLTEINSKFYQECDVIMLPTKGKSNIHITTKCDNYDPHNKELNIFKPYLIFKPELKGSHKNTQAYHLYILSSEEIKEGDWVYHPEVSQEYTIVDTRKEGDDGYSKGQHPAQGVFQYKNTTNKWYKKCKKIIATTDESLDITGDRVPVINDVANMMCRLPRPSDDFIKAFVKAQGKITKVLVEYEADVYNECPFTCEATSPYSYKLKVAKDNTITIKPTQEDKTSWSREEIVALIQKLEKDGADYFGQAFLEQWIEENL